MAWRVVAAVAEIPPGARKLVDLGGRAVVVFNLAGEFFALNNRCPHLGGSLHHGLQTALVQSTEPGRYERSRCGEVIKCPWHGWEFDIRSGRSFCEPTRVRARQYPVAVHSGAELVDAPLAAETIPVRVEENYVVLEA